MQQVIYLAGGCLWGVQEYIKYLPGVITTTAGRANGRTQTTQGDYDGYAECVEVTFDATKLSLNQLFEAFFEIIDPYSINQQGQDRGLKYRTGIYSRDEMHLTAAKQYIMRCDDSEKIAVEVMALTRFVASDDEHQHRLTRHPEDHYLCHIPWNLLHKYKR
ncbi:MAG: peptide-methionine (S)-S-oxide reductase [Vibrio sp.]